jgi:hypothetical protein
MVSESIYPIFNCADRGEDNKPTKKRIEIILFIAKKSDYKLKRFLLMVGT